MQKPWLIDTHCHVHFQAYQADMHEIVQRALNKNIAMITIGTQSTTSATGADLATQYDGVFATIGLHPNHVHKQEFFDANELPPELEVKNEGHVKTRSEHFDADYYGLFVNQPCVVGVGECGLDYYRMPEGADPEIIKAEQKLEAVAQIEFATKVNKPLVIHCRDAHDDQYALLKAEIDKGGLSKRGVIHSFTGTLAEALRYIDIGFYIAFNGIVTFSKELPEVAKQIPLEYLLVETDSPYLTPAPNRGKRNEPAHVEDIAKFIADLRGISLDEFAAQTTNNAIKLFDLPYSL
jgi:TatD DNase family protein